MNKEKVPCINCIALAACISKVKGHIEYFESRNDNYYMTAERILIAAIAYMFSNSRCELALKYVDDTKTPCHDGKRKTTYDYKAFIPYLGVSNNNE